LGSVALLLAACSTDPDAVQTNTGDAAETVWTASGKCARRGKQMRCGSATTIVLARFPTTATVDGTRQEVWSALVDRFGADRFEIEQADPQQQQLVVNYTGIARPFVECGRPRTEAGKTQMGKTDTSPGKLQTRLLVRLTDASSDKTTVHVATRHVLKHKDPTIEDPVEIEDRSVVPLGDGRICWSTGKLEQSALTPVQQ
jgi:hypothetical protein